MSKTITGKNLSEEKEIRNAVLEFINSCADIIVSTHDQHKVYDTRPLSEKQTEFKKALKQLGPFTDPQINPLIEKVQSMVHEFQRELGRQTRRRISSLDQLTNVQRSVYDERYEFELRLREIGGLIERKFNEKIIEEENLKVAEKRRLPRPEEISDKKESQESTNLRVLNGLVGEADKEINIIWNAMIRQCKSLGVKLDSNNSSELNEVAIDTLNDPEYKFKWVQEIYLKDLNFFTETRNAVRQKRYFREHLLAQVVKDNTYKKDINISEIRKLLEKSKKRKKIN